MQSEEPEPKSESDNEDDANEQEQKKWDCETILSTYTNTDNHPGLIKSVVQPRKFDLPKIDLRPKHQPERGGHKVIEEVEEAPEEKSEKSDNEEDEE